VRLVGVSNTSHTRHHTENVVVNSVHTDLGGRDTGNGGGRENELEDSVINAGEVATATGLVFLRAKGKAVYVDACIRGTGVVLPRLDNIEVAALTLREAVLAVELELGSYDGVLAPTVHVKSSLGKDEGAGIGYEGSGGVGTITEWDSTPLFSFILKTGSIKSTGHLEESRSCDESVIVFRLSYRSCTTESVDGIGKGIDRIGVVEGLGTECAVEDATSIKG
jgi:hypothetical protein